MEVELFSGDHTVLVTVELVSDELAQSPGNILLFQDQVVRNVVLVVSRSFDSILHKNTSQHVHHGKRKETNR